MIRTDEQQYVGIAEIDGAKPEIGEAFEFTMGAEHTVGPRVQAGT